MSLGYSHIQVWIREEDRWRGAPLHEALVERVRSRRIAARAAVLRAESGCFEGGGLASRHVVDLAHDLPLIVEIVAPTAEADSLLEELGEMVSDGLVIRHEVQLHSYRAAKRLLPPGLRVRDVMSSAPTAADPETPLAEVVETLLSAPFNGIPVKREGRIIGIITQSDLIERGGMPLRLGLLADFGAGAHKSGIAGLRERTAADIMTPDPVVVREDMQLTDAVELMVNRNLKRLPVLHEDGSLAGMLSRVDVFRAVMRETPDWRSLETQNVVFGGDSRVEDAAIHDVPTVGPDTPLTDIVALVDVTEAQRVVVVDEDERPVGIIADRDLLAAFAPPPSAVSELAGTLGQLLGIGGEGIRGPSGLQNRTARDAMTAPPVTIPESARLEEAMKLMTENNLKRIPVVDEDGRYRGMLSRHDLLHAVVPRRDA